MKQGGATMDFAMDWDKLPDRVETSRGTAKPLTQEKIDKDVEKLIESAGADQPPKSE